MKTIYQVRLFNDYAIVSLLKVTGETISSKEVLPFQARYYINNYRLGFMYDDGECKWYW